MKKIIEFFKKLFSKNNKQKEIINNKVKNINWDLIKKLNKNDIVLVKMNKDEIEKGNIKEEHQKRPFYISKIRYEKEETLGYYFTSNINNYYFRKEKTKGLKLILNKEKYNINKNTLLEFQKPITIPFENIIHLLDHLQNNDLAKLKKYRSLLLNQNVISNKDNIVIEINDVILDNDKLYAIYQIDNTFCYGYNIKKSNKKIDLEINHNYIKFDNELYYVNYKDFKTYSKTDTLCIKKRFNDDTIEKIRQNKKELKYERKLEKKEKLKRKQKRK